MEQMSNAEVTSSQTAAPEQSYTAPAEKMLPQSKVDEIVKSVKHETAQKIHSQYTNGAQSQQQTAPAIDLDEIKRVAAHEGREEAKRLHAETLAQQQQQFNLQRGEQIAAEFNSKLEAVKDKYSDFDATVKGFPFASFPNSVFISSGLENGGDVMVELAKNPTKFDQIESLALRNPALARAEMEQLSKSIALNEKAATVKKANAPLSQIRPSSIGSDNGAPTLRDLKLRYRG